MPTTQPDNPRPRRVRAGTRAAARRLERQRERRGRAGQNGAEASRPPLTAAAAGATCSSAGGGRRHAPAASPAAHDPAVPGPPLHLGAGAAATVYTGYNIYLGQIPDAATVAGMEPAVDTNVYAADGTLIAVLHPSGYFHLHADLDQISQYLQEATVDVEDRHFWSESSLDLGRIAEAGWGYLRHANAGGASTIPEQLAKISFLQDNGSLAYKIKEIILGSRAGGRLLQGRRSWRCT